MPTSSFRRSVLSSWPLAWLVLTIGVAVQAMFLQSVLVDRTLASQWFSTVTWSEAAGHLGGLVDAERCRRWVQDLADGGAPLVVLGEPEASLWTRLLGRTRED